MGAMLTILLTAAQAASPPAPPARAPIVRVVPGPAALDPTRVAAAEALVAKVFPPGTYAKLMAGDLRSIAMALARKADEESEAGAKADPHAEERRQIAMDVILDELSDVLVGMEPGVRAAMARAYARRFTAPEMGELGKFFSTALGQKYALESLKLVEDPELLAQFMAMEPRMQAAMPKIIEKAINATAHLPEPPSDSTS